MGSTPCTAETTSGYKISPAGAEANFLFLTLAMTEKPGKPNFSVIIPNHNGSRTLAEALDSIFAASDSSIEVILVDDASTDDSQTVADRYPIRWIAHDSCRGAASARNTGARAARGEILVFTDTDIVLPPDIFEILEKDYADPETDGIIGLLRPITRYGNLCSQYKNFYMHYTYSKLPEEVTVFYTSIASIRRGLFLEAGGFDGTYRSATIEDMEFGVRLTGKGYRILIDKKLQVEHIRHYTLISLIRTGFVRAAGMTKIALRDRNNRREKSSYVTTRPAFLAGMTLSFMTIFLLLLSIVWINCIWACTTILCYLGIIALNTGFLIGLARKTCIFFFFSGCGLLFIDLLSHGCGVCWGAVSFLGGKKY